MNYVIQIPCLIELLRNAEDENERFAEPAHDFNDGVKYLFAHVLQPLMKGQEVYTGDVDMERFDREDIGTVFEFYEDNYARHSKEISHLKHWYDTCCKAPAECMQTPFL